MLYDDIEVNLLNQPLALRRGKLGSDGDEAPAGPQDAERMCDVIDPIGTLKISIGTLKISVGTLQISVGKLKSGADFWRCVTHFN